MRRQIFLLTTWALMIWIGGASTSVAQSPTEPADTETFRGLTDAQQRQLRQRISQTIREAGVLASADVLEIRCQVEGESVVLSVIPEGSDVKKGDLLAELDSSLLEQQRSEQQIVVAQAQEAAAASAADIEQAAVRAKVFLPLAQQKLEAAKLAREQYLGPGGEHELEVARADHEIAIAKARLQTVEALQSSSRLDKASPELSNAQMALKLAESTKKLLTGYTHAYQTAVFKAAISEAQAQVLQSEIELNRAIEASQTELKTNQLAYESAANLLKELEQQIQDCRIVAPRDGIVLYAENTARRASTLEPGATVRERQTLLRMPDPQQVYVNVHVHESQIARVQSGQNVILVFDAFPGERVSGKVTRIDNVPVPSTWLASDVVQYNVRVAMDQPPAKLKLGMSAVAEIRVDSSQDE